MNSFVKGIMIQMRFHPVQERFAFHFQDNNSENEWIRRPQGWFHQVDVAGTTWYIHPQTQKKIKFKHLVELDGESHNYKRQQNKDETSEYMIAAYYTKYPIMGEYVLTRIKKEVVVEAMKSGNHDQLCLRLFVNLPGSPITFLPHMVKELKEEKIRDDR